MILTIKTDQPQAELALYTNTEQLAHTAWEGHKQLSDTILHHITSLLEENGHTLDALSGLVVFAGPGSFTGLRIGVTVANTLAYGLSIPVVGASGPHWQEDGLKRLREGQNDEIVKPYYGGEANITSPKK